MHIYTQQYLLTFTRYFAILLFSLDSFSFSFFGGVDSIFFVHLCCGRREDQRIIYELANPRGAVRI
jgi:hypothetical protein